MYDFQQLEIIRSFGHSIFTGEINIVEAKLDQTNLLENMVKFNYKFKLKTKENKNKKQNLFDSLNALQEGGELTPNAFRSVIFPIKATAYFIKGTRTRTQTFRKSGPRTFRKSGPYTKINCMH